MEPSQDKELIDFLLSRLTTRRRALFDEVLGWRTHKVAVVLEDIYQPHNASAVVRSCDCFGIQDIHIIEEKNEWSYNPEVEMGSSKWVSVHRYNSQPGHNAKNCLATLKSDGYSIVGTSPHAGDNSLENLVISQPTAFVFGNELEGISPLIKKEADTLVKLPMYGFTESFNISVSAAITLYAARRKLEESGLDWQLDEKEKNALRYRWAWKSIKHPQVMVNEFLSRYR